jgi:Mg2+/Co2+ transporter CorB
MPAVTMDLTATADQVLNALNDNPGATSVVLVDEQQRPRFTVDRTRFLLRISGAYGHALHAHKPASRLSDPPRLVPKTVPAIAALRAAGKESERVYDDLVVIDEIGRCLGIVRVGDLIRSLSP